ncbi:hypothetical protein [Streptomyces sp. G-G2]|uniref:hypothetical protein n=1 Tax=Streptomyces sp. G-G2 TaxID=3046201 RepID=UPI0024BB4E96|nr:hypothetical protein [Streptomyces sp. G-G2]MDJ0383545.1 hypothetical protein [Streptomyces sp. G-G2]
MNTAGRSQLLVGIDPDRDWYLPLAWAADEARRRRLGIRLAVAAPSQHDTRKVDATAHTTAQHQRGSDASATAAARAHERPPEGETETDPLDGFPAPVLARPPAQAHMVVFPYQDQTVAPQAGRRVLCERVADWSEKITVSAP